MAHPTSHLEQVAVLPVWCLSWRVDLGCPQPPGGHVLPSPRIPLKRRKALPETPPPPPLSPASSWFRVWKGRWVDRRGATSLHLSPWLRVLWPQGSMASLEGHVLSPLLNPNWQFQGSVKSLPHRMSCSARLWSLFMFYKRSPWSSRMGLQPQINNTALENLSWIYTLYLIST